MYPEHLVAPMIADLTSAGVKELKTPEEVEKVLNDDKGTKLVIVNSVCGCAAGSARPGVKMALKESEVTPDEIYTVFAGVDKDAVSKAREFFMPYPPSSPSIALFKNGELVHFVERHHIEGRNAQMIAQHLKQVFEEFCD